MLSFVVRSRLLRSHTTWPAKRRSWPPPERPTLRETAQRRQSRRNCRTNWKSANKTHRRWALQLQRLWAHHYVNIMSNNPKRKWAAILFQSIRVWVSVAWLMSDWMPLLLFSESFLFLKWTLITFYYPNHQVSDSFPVSEKKIKLFLD